MSQRRPCRICKRWFEVDPRVGPRHRTCGEASCRAEQNRRACKKWRQDHPDQVIARRLRQRLPADPAPTPAEVSANPLRQFDPEVVRHVIGVEMRVLLEELLKVLLRVVRHEMPPRVPESPARSAKVLPLEPRLETDRARGPP